MSHKINANFLREYVCVQELNIFSTYAMLFVSCKLAFIKFEILLLTKEVKTKM
jgi:hypothetical protein